MLIVGVLMTAANAQPTQPDVVFQEDFADPTLPGWQGARVAESKWSPTEGPDGIPALSMEVHQGASTTLSVPLPVERIAFLSCHVFSCQVCMQLTVYGVRSALIMY